MPAFDLSLRMPPDCCRPPRPVFRSILLAGERSSLLSTPARRRRLARWHAVCKHMEVGFSHMRVPGNALGTEAHVAEALSLSGRRLMRLVGCGGA